jgi:hypothetical protein
VSGVPAHGSVPAAAVPASPVPEGLKRELRAINVGVWMVAVVVMVVSATTAARELAEHGMHPLQGLALGLAVDAGIVVALVGDRMLHRVVGRRSRWGTALRLVTASMSLLLNCAGAWQAGDQLGVALHALPPVLLIVLTEAAQAYRMGLPRSSTPALPARPVPGTGSAGTGPALPPQYPAGGTAAVGTGCGGIEHAGTAAALPAGTAPAPDASVAAPVPNGAGLALVRRQEPKPAAAEAATPEWDQQLWQRAVALAEQHHREHGREIRLDDVQAGLSIGRNRAAALRRDVLAHLQRQEASA